jgi:MFS transporter, ACS family, allantoate permease
MSEVEKLPPTEKPHNVESQRSEQIRLGGRPDVAASFLEGLSAEIRDQPIYPEESRKLLWKIDLILIPLLSISVIIAAVDKVIISNAAIYGMKEDTNLVGDQFSWVGSIFYFGFLLAEWPGNLLIQKLPIRTFYGATVLCWAGLTFATGGTHNFAGLASVRFLSEAVSMHDRERR